MALVAVLVTLLGIAASILIAIQVVKWLERRKIDKRACAEFERYFNVHAEAEAEMKKLYVTVNTETRKALDTHFGHSISFIRRAADVDNGSGNRSLSVRW